MLNIFELKHVAFFISLVSLILTYFTASSTSLRNILSKPTKVNFSKVLFESWQSSGLAEALHQMFTARLRPSEET